MQKNHDDKKLYFPLDIANLKKKKKKRRRRKKKKKKKKKKLKGSTYVHNPVLIT